MNPVNPDLSVLYIKSKIKNGVINSFMWIPFFSETEYLKNVLTTLFHVMEVNEQWGKEKATINM